MIKRIIRALETRNDRSAWCKGVTGYALEIMETVESRTEYENHEPRTLAELKKYMLNGADTWKDASRGGCFEIYDGDIAKRLCTPSELKKTRNGERTPNSREQWLDTQARALYQASLLIERIYKTLETTPTAAEIIADNVEDVAKVA